MFELLKQDYEKKLTGNPCIIIQKTIPVRDISDLNIPEISSGIQHKVIKTIEDVQNA